MLWQVLGPQTPTPAVRSPQRNHFAPQNTGLRATRRRIRRSIGYVGENPFLFFRPVRDNLLYGVESATDEEIIGAAEAATANRFSEHIEEGYETPVGQRGGKLSGGQRQRLSIASALLWDPEILILHETTSGVDTETELRIQTALERVTEGRTTFVIAHRLSTIRDADKILVREDGRTVEPGTHEELLANGGLYALLWQAHAGLLEELPAEFIERAAERTAGPAGKPSRYTVDVRRRSCVVDDLHILLAGPDRTV